MRNRLLRALSSFPWTTRTKSAAAIAALCLSGLAVGDSVARKKKPPKPLPVASSQIAAVIEGKTLESSTLLGISGQVYKPVSTGGWKRTGRGGVACRVVAGFNIGGELWAMCSQAPLFRLANTSGSPASGAVWSAEHLNNRGRTRAAQLSSKPLISVGRHLYGRKGSTWTRLGSAPSRITSLLATDSRSGLAVTSRRELLRLKGKAWNAVITPPKRRKPTDDPPLSLFGSAKNAYVVFKSGSISHIGATKPKAVSLPSGVTGFELAASCPEPKGTVLALGMSSQAAGEKLELLRLSGNRATSAGSAPALEKGDRPTLLHCSGERALLGTASGRLYLRDADSWTEKALDDAPEDETSKTTPGSRPARTR